MCMRMHECIHTNECTCARITRTHVYACVTDNISVTDLSDRNIVPTPYIQSPPHRPGTHNALMSSYSLKEKVNSYIREFQFPLASCTILIHASPSSSLKLP